jgi:hypothetical protein
MRPAVARSGRVGLFRADPRIPHWAPLELARRRALAVALSEAEAADQRDDPLVIRGLWHQLVAELSTLQPAQRRIVSRETE